MNDVSRRSGTFWSPLPRDVCLHGSQVVRVEKVNRVYVVWVDEDGKRWRGDPSSLVPAPAGTEFHLKVEGDDQVFSVGQVVRFRRPSDKQAGLFVVVKLGAASYNVARLGGDGNRYLGNVSPYQIQLVDVANGDLRHALFELDM